MATGLFVMSFRGDEYFYLGLLGLIIGNGFFKPNDLFAIRRDNKTVTRPCTVSSTRRTDAVAIKQEHRIWASGAFALNVSARLINPARLPLREI